MDTKSYHVIITQVVDFTLKKYTHHWKQAITFEHHEHCACKKDIRLKVKLLRAHFG